MSAVVTLEAAGTELHIVLGGRLFAIPVCHGYAKRRDVIDLGYDADLGMQDLVDVYRNVERLGVSFDTAAYTGRLCLTSSIPVFAPRGPVYARIEVLTIYRILLVLIGVNFMKDIA